MKNQNAQTRLDVQHKFNLVKIKDGRYYVKFPFMQCNVEMNEEFYNNLIRNSSQGAGESERN